MCWVPYTLFGPSGGPRITCLFIFVQGHMEVLLWVSRFIAWIEFYIRRLLATPISICVLKELGLTCVLFGPAERRLSILRWHLVAFLCVKKEDLRGCKIEMLNFVKNVMAVESNMRFSRRRFTCRKLAE